MKIIKTKSGEMPNDIGVISEGYLVYCYLKLTTLKKMKDRKIEDIIRLNFWLIYVITKELNPNDYI